MSRAKNHEYSKLIEDGFSLILYQEGDVKGWETIKGLMKLWGKVRFTFPNIDDFNNMQRDKKMRNEFNGANLKELALKNNLSETRARQIIHGTRKKKEIIGG